MDNKKLEIINSFLTNFDFLEIKKICNYINNMVEIEQRNRTIYQKFSEENIESMEDAISKGRHF